MNCLHCGAPTTNGLALCDLCVTWRYPWCHTIAREVHGLIRDGLQKEWE